MHMSFWWDADLGDLLFSGLSVHTVGAMIITCVLVSIITVIFEGMKTLETKVKRDHHKRTRLAMLGRCAEDRNNLLTPGPSSQEVEVSEPSYLNNGFLVTLHQVSIYTANTSINYMIMLIVMLFNGYLAVAIVVGTTVGYYVFGHISVKYNMKSVMEKMQVAVVCVPECDGGANESTPPLGQSSCSSNPDGGACGRSRSRSRESSPSHQLLVKCSGGKCGKNKVQCCCSAKKTTDSSKIKKSEPVKDSDETEDCEKTLLGNEEIVSCCKSRQSAESEEKTSL